VKWDATVFRNIYQTIKHCQRSKCCLICFGTIYCTVFLFCFLLRNMEWVIQHHVLWTWSVPIIAKNTLKSYMTGLDRQRNGLFVNFFLYFVHNITHEVYGAVDFIYMMHICYSPGNLYNAVSVCTVCLVREHSCPLMNLTSSHCSLNLQFSHKPPCILQPYTATCRWSGIVFCNVFSVVIFLCGLIWTEAEKNKTQNPPQFYRETVKQNSNKTAYVGSLRVNHTDIASRFIVGLIELPITNNCSVANASFTVLNYSTPTTCKFSEDVVSMSVNAVALQLMWV
jgi:hypothetical protein